MHNKIVFLSTGLMLVAGLATAQQKPFTINGNIQGKTGGYIYLAYQQDGNYTTDSSLIENGKFSFKGKLEGPTLASLVTRNGRSYDKYTQLYLVPANMKLSVVYDRFDEAKLTGSPVQAEADALQKSKEPIRVKIKALSEAYSKANEVYRAAVAAKKDEATLKALKDAAQKIKDAMDPYSEQAAKLDEAFMDKHPASFVTASILRYRISNMSLQEGEERYSKLPADIKNSSLGKELKGELDGLRMGSPGATAFVFASKELRGEPLSLADYKGKYVLVDFWASWCVPCRKGNPHLLSLYSKYKDKGFEIIGISDDDGSPDAWKKAVDKDGIGVWKHVLRGLKYNGNGNFDRTNDISDRFGIHSLPTKILIDPNGVIIGRYGGGGEGDDAMDKKFAEIFGE
jgi:thiol-disulfide isomerase/thioredoxin